MANLKACRSNDDLPENSSFKIALNKAKNKVNPVPPAPTSLADIELDSCMSNAYYIVFYSLKF